MSCRRRPNASTSFSFPLYHQFFMNPHFICQGLTIYILSNKKFNENSPISLSHDRDYGILKVFLCNHSDPFLMSILHNIEKLIPGSLYFLSSLSPTLSTHSVSCKQAMLMLVLIIQSTNCMHWATSK